MTTTRPITIDDLVPYPRSVEDVTADAMARHFTAFAQLHWRIAMDHPDRDKSRESISMFTNCYGIAYLLREQPARDGDRVARKLWETWNSGQCVGTDLWEWMAEYGIGPHTIDGIAARLIAEDDPKPETASAAANQSELPLEGGA